MNDTMTKDLRKVWTDSRDSNEQPLVSGFSIYCPLLRVEREKYEKSAVYFSTSVFSYYDDKYFYLEQDHDAPRYLESINLHWLDIPELPLACHQLPLNRFSTYTTKWDSELD